MTADLPDPEDAKLLTHARAQKARTSAAEAAAIRDCDGRTYSAASVDLPSLQLSALQAAVAMAVSSGVGRLEAALVITDRPAVESTDVAVVRDFGGTGVVIYRADTGGAVTDSVTT